MDFFEQFCQFSCDDDSAGWFEDIGKRPDGIVDAVRRFVNDQRGRRSFQFLQNGLTLRGFRGQKTDEEERFIGQAAGGKRGDDCRWAWNRNDIDASFPDGIDDFRTRVGYGRCACIGNQCDTFALLQAGDQFFCRFAFVVLMRADQFFLQSVNSKQIFGYASILASDGICDVQNMESAQADVTSITDRRTDHI